MKKIIGLVFISLLASTSISYAAGDAYNPLKVPLGSNDIMQYVVEDGAVQTTGYIAIDPPVTTDGTPRIWKWCENLKDPVCDPTKNPANLEALSVLGPCESAAEENCIDSLEIGVDASHLSPAKLIRKTDNITFPASPEYGFVGSSTISLWDAPNVPSASGLTTYALTATEHLHFYNGKFSITDFFAGVTPYRIQNGDYSKIAINKDPNALPQDRYVYKGENNSTCVFAEDGICGVAQDFTPNTRIRMKVRLSKNVGGWFRGRIQDPVLDVTNFSSDYNLVTVDASTVVVPRLAIPKLKANFTATEKNWFPNFGYWGTPYGQGSGPQAGIPETAFPFIAYYRDQVKDTSAGTNSYWNFTTTAWGNGSKCLQDKSKILGVVSTNSMAYDGNAPSFENGVLNYHVSGLHFMPDGTTPVTGTYNLVMRSDIARCLYNFTNAPISATVSISGEAGTTVATTTTNERNGWLSMAAAGFTFSEKTIQVKLTQEVVKPTSSVVLKPGSPQAVIPVQNKKATISCVKGKTVKKVTGVNPKCPSGYKKK